jgi:hypothetical protein
MRQVRCNTCQKTYEKGYKAGHEKARKKSLPIAGYGAEE